MTGSAPPAASAQAAEGGRVGDELEDVAAKKAQKLINEILEAQAEANSNPMLIHSLSALLASICPLRQPDIIHGILKHVNALLPEGMHCVVELALQLLECQQDQARINSVKFFSSSFICPAILDSFDSKDGLKKFLNILQSAAPVQSGGSNATPNPEVLTMSEKQIAYYICVALRQYFRAHLLLVLDTLSGGVLSGSGDVAANKPLDISNEAINEVFVQIRTNGELSRKLVWSCWPVAEQFLKLNGHITLLELCQTPTMEGYLHDLAQCIFDILQIVTFVQCTRRSIVTARLSNNRIGMAVILDAANAVGNYGLEVIGPALSVLINLVCPTPPPISKKPLTVPFGSNAAPTSAVVKPLFFSPRLPSIRKRPITISSGSNAAPTPTLVKRSRLTCDFMLKRGRRWACEEVRDNNGINVLLNLLNSSMNMPPDMVEYIRALACPVLLGLAMDETIADIMTRLQVEKQLSKLIGDTPGQPAGGDQGRWKNELIDVANELITTLTDYQKTTRFPFHALPIHIQESILSRVPVMDLIRLVSISKDFRSLLISPTFPPPPPDLFFLLFSINLYKDTFGTRSPKLLSFHPSSSRWIELPIPSNSLLCNFYPLVTSSSLAVTATVPFNLTLHVAVQMFSYLSLQKTAPMIYIGNPSVVAVIPDGDVSLSGHFKIVATSYSFQEVDMLYSQVYDSRQREWVLHGAIKCCLERPHKAAVLNNSLYMRSCKPDQLLQFDLTSGTWNYVLPMPECLCTHIFSHNQNIYLVVGQGRSGKSFLSIRVFVLDWIKDCGSPKWREISVLSESDEAFVEFRGNKYVMRYFSAVDQNGLVCLFNNDNTVLLFDVRKRTWALLPPRPLVRDYPCWYGYATELGLEVWKSKIAHDF